MDLAPELVIIDSVNNLRRAAAGYREQEADWPLRFQLKENMALEHIPMLWEAVSDEQGEWKWVNPELLVNKGHALSFVEGLVRVLLKTRDDINQEIGSGRSTTSSPWRRTSRTTTHHGASGAPSCTWTISRYLFVLVRSDCYAFPGLSCVFDLPAGSSSTRGPLFLVVSALVPLFALLCLRRSDAVRSLGLHGLLCVLDVPAGPTRGPMLGDRLCCSSLDCIDFLGLCCSYAFSILRRQPCFVSRGPVLRLPDLLFLRVLDLAAAGLLRISRSRAWISAARFYA